MLNYDPKALAAREVHPRFLGDEEYYDDDWNAPDGDGGFDSAATAAEYEVYLDALAAGRVDQMPEYDGDLPF